MPETRRTKPNDDAEQLAGAEQPEPREDSADRSPSAGHDRREATRRDANEADDPEYTGRDWRDDEGGRGAPPPPDADRDRREPAGDQTERPAHAGAARATTLDRSSSSWGPVFSGAATAFVVVLIFSALWGAITASGAGAVGENLAWFQLISGVLAAAAGGAAAGWLDPRGTLTGMIQGLATWGLLVLAMTFTGLTTGTALLGAVGTATLDATIGSANVTEMLQPFEAQLWALFALLLGGALIAGLAGALTGRAHRSFVLDE